MKRTIAKAAVVGASLMLLAGTGFAAAEQPAIHSPARASVTPPTTAHPKKPGHAKVTKHTHGSKRRKKSSRAKNKSGSSRKR